MRVFALKISSIVTALGLLTGTATALTDTHTIGVLAYQGEAEAIARWEPTAQYLSDQIAGHSFKIAPYDLNTLRVATAQKKIDFALTNPGHYVGLETNFGASRILTVQGRHGETAKTQFAAVIIARAQRTELNHLADLQDQSLGIVSRAAFGGFQMAWRELRTVGIDPVSDTNKLVSFGFPQDDIVLAVRDGVVDAGTVRTGVVERLIAAGQVDAGELKVIGGRNTPGFNLMHSTRLYPEWPLAKLSHTATSLSKQVVQALLDLEADHLAAVSARINGWTIPLDYQSVHELLRELDISPYEPRPLTWAETVRLYQTELAFAVVLLLILAGTTAWVYRANLRLKSSQQELGLHRDNLEKEVAHRTNELRQTNLALSDDIVQRQKVEHRLHRSREALQSLYEISVARHRPHDLRMQDLLSLGRSHFRADAGYLFQESGDTPLLQDIAQGTKLPTSVSGYVADILESGDDIESGVLGDDEGGKYRVVGVRFESGSNSASALVFARLESEPEEEDREILHLMAELIGAEMIQQSIEDESARHRAHLSHMIRVSTLGEMTSGLAHEINQPLTGALNYINGTLRRLRSTNHNPDELETGLNQAAASISRATGTIQHLRQLLRTGSPKKEPFDVAQTIRKIIDLCSAEARQKNATIILNLSETPTQITADKIQVEQIILNLLRNAIEAIPAAGQITVDLTTTREQVRVGFSDNGPGLDRDHIEKIFEPFFSTKPSGMGLGLSICRSIVQAHDGQLHAENTADGSIFILEFPLSASQ